MAHDDPEVDGWVSTTADILNQAFGQPNGEAHPKTSSFVHASSGLPVQRAAYGHRPDPREIQRRYLLKQEKRKALLNAYIEQLHDNATPSAATPDAYVFHSEIERVSGDLYRDGHYKQAALEAYIRVIEQVKTVSGIPEDGDSLMNKAFGSSERQAPVIQFNSLATKAEYDEQQGFMYLFKGIVQIRNSKAHSNRLFSDPSRAHEYLALASLLMRLLEIAKVNRA